MKLIKHREYNEFALAIQTDSFPEKFFHEMTAYITGKTTHYSPDSAQDIADDVPLEVSSTFDDLVREKNDEDGDEYVCAYNDHCVIIYLSGRPSQEAFNLIKQRATEFLALRDQNKLLETLGLPFIKYLPGKILDYTLQIRKSVTDLYEDPL